MARLLLGARLFLGMCFLLFAVAPASAQQSFNQQEQAEIRAIVREYLVRNPDVLKEALDALQTRVSENRWREIIADRRDFSIGPANAPIIVVEYFDYRCPYCHSAYEWVNNLVRTRDDVRLILKELPVLGPGSMEAARASLAAMPQGRYWAFHGALIAYRGDLTSEAIDAVARQAGIDVPRMRRAMESPDITRQLEQIRAQAIEYQFEGTPGFVINGKTVPGFNRSALEAQLREAGRQVRERERAQR